MQALIAILDGMITNDLLGGGGLGLSITATGRIEDKPKDNRSEGRVLNTWALVLIEHGHGTFSSRPSRRHAVGAGTLLVLFPGVAHWYHPDPSWTEWWLLFEGPLAARIQEAGFIAPTRAALRADARCRGAFQRAWRDWHEGGPLGRALAAAALHECLVASASAAAPAGEDEAADPVRSAATTLECNPGATPAGIARQLGVPYPTLRRRFRAATGRSMRDYALDARLRQAQALLAETERGIADVAATCGFEDAFYFSRLFHRRVGLSPSEFRRRLPR